MYKTALACIFFIFSFSNVSAMLQTDVVKCDELALAAQERIERSLSAYLDSIEMAGKYSYIDPQLMLNDMFIIKDYIKQMEETLEWTRSMYGYIPEKNQEVAQKVSDDFKRICHCNTISGWQQIQFDQLDKKDQLINLELAISLFREAGIKSRKGALSNQIYAKKIKARLQEQNLHQDVQQLLKTLLNQIQ